MKADPQQLKAFLLDADLISEQDFERVQKRADASGKTLEDLLVRDGKISQEDLVRLLIGKPYDFVFYGRAVSWPYALYLAGVHG